MKQALEIVKSIFPNQLRSLVCNAVHIQNKMPAFCNKITLYRKFKVLHDARVKREIKENKTLPIIMFDPSLYLDEEKVAKLPTHLQAKYLTNKQLSCIARLKAMNEVRSNEKDTSSIKVKMAALSARCEGIDKHIERRPKDIQSKFYRRKVKYIRKLTMRYAKMSDFPLYHELRKKHSMSELDVCIDRFTWINRAKIFKKKKFGIVPKAAPAK